MTYSRGAAYGRGASAYARVGVESGVLSADPHQLIVLLFDGAQASLRAARIHMQAGNVAEKGKAISKTIDIVNSGLAAALDREKGGEIAERLASLYDYIGRLLLTANLRNDEESLNQAESLLEDLASAWREIGQSQSA
ncbi:flagellar export chaperone FliS [Halomonas dongshanensis]|uniref:Flagellar secretion chaperone FliS n=1 Tax=Halomonas dongshanensis TaxID=2890835 RepID=A0ABT2EI32_9GAMM|nr:flagellar export chaperone FliS [Halomonas dongshanensis]MCS2610252.1 flagellar export chaperone FliS [Halomonas dongshanensis]